MSKPDWWNYGPCPTCEQIAGEPCFDLRCKPYLGVVSHRKAPHPQRKRNRVTDPLDPWSYEVFNFNKGVSNAAEAGA